MNAGLRELNHLSKEEDCESETERIPRATPLRGARGPKNVFRVQCLGAKKQKPALRAAPGVMLSSRRCPRVPTPLGTRIARANKCQPPENIHETRRIDITQEGAIDVRVTSRRHDTNTRLTQSYHSSQITLRANEVKSRIHKAINAAQTHLDRQ
jgi:hypothetical protein